MVVITSFLLDKYCSVYTETTMCTRLCTPAHTKKPRKIAGCVHCVHCVHRKSRFTREAGVFFRFCGLIEKNSLKLYIHTVFSVHSVHKMRVLTKNVDFPTGFAVYTWGVANVHGMYTVYTDRVLSGLNVRL